MPKIIFTSRYLRDAPTAQLENYVRSVSYTHLDVYKRQNPDCDFMSWQKPSSEKCPKCGSYMVEKGNRLLCSEEQCGYSMNLKDK